MPNSPLKWLFLVLNLLWITGVTAAYFIFAPQGDEAFSWKTASEGLQLILEHVVWQYLLLFLMLACAWIAGGKLCAALKLQFNGVLEETVFHITSGMVVLSFAIMLLGFMHLLYPPALVIFLILLIAVLNKTLRSNFKRVSDALRGAKITGVQLILLMILLVCVLLVSFNPLYPPVSLDAVNAYLSMAKGYLQAGWFELDPYIKYSMVPNNHTLILTLAMGLGDEVTAVLTHFAAWCILLAAITAFGSRYLSPTGGLCGAIGFALIPVTTVTATWGNAENFIALYAFMSFWAVWRFVKSRSRGDAIIAGILLGFTLGLKIFMVIFWLCLLLPAKLALCGRLMKFPVKNWLIMVFISLLLVLPWFGRNMAYFGNPVFPYFNNLFEDQGGIYEEYEEDLQSDARAGLDGFSPGANNVTIWNLPVEMTFWPSWGSKTSARGQMRFAERKIHGIGPLFIALLPLLIFVRRKWDVLAGLLIVSLLCILAWFFGMKVIYIRYWSFFFPFLMTAGGFAFAEVLGLEGLSFRKPAGLLLMGLIATLTILHFLNNVMPLPGGGHLPLKDTSREAHLAGNIVGYEFIERLNNMDPEPRVYYLYGATSRFYCDFFVIAGFTSPHNYNRFWEHASSGKELHGWLSEIGISHLLVNEKQMASYRKMLPLDKSFRENIMLIEKKDRVALYELKVE